MVRHTVFSLALTALVGCTTTEYIQTPVEVLVPVTVARKAPEWLATPYTPEHLPVFISPLDPSAKAALSETSLNDLKAILRTLTARDEGWRVWAIDPEAPNVQSE